MKADSRILIPAGIGGIFLYRRIRRSIGFQPFSKGRSVFQIGLFSLLGLLGLSAGLFQPALLLAAGAGLAVGTGLAYYGVRHLVHELRGGVLYTKTHIIIETTALALFLGRLAYRILASPIGEPLGPGDPPNPMLHYSSDPATIALLSITVAYYVGYNSWLLRKGPQLALRGEKWGKLEESK